MIFRFSQKLTAKIKPGPLATVPMDVTESSERELGYRISSPRKDVGMESEMTQTALVELLRLFGSAAFPVWLDGGWGIDARLQTQTRTHKDVDIVLPVADVTELQRLLGTRGFSVRAGTPPYSFVLADGAGLEIDVHAVAFDDDGNDVYRMQNHEDWVYPAEGFSGRGLVGGLVVRCLSPTTQVLCHAHGYVPVEKDFSDMERLEERFGVVLPPQLQRGSSKSTP
jgi:lincosamide nucleotidyltransferase A/C/D/E